MGTTAPADVVKLRGSDAYYFGDKSTHIGQSTYSIRTGLLDPMKRMFATREGLNRFYTISGEKVPHDLADKMLKTLAFPKEEPWEVTLQHNESGLCSTLFRQLPDMLPGSVARPLTETAMIDYLDNAHILSRLAASLDPDAYGAPGNVHNLGIAPSMVWYNRPALDERFVASLDICTQELCNILMTDIQVNRFILNIREFRFSLDPAGGKERVVLNQRTSYQQSGNFVEVNDYYQLAAETVAARLKGLTFPYPSFGNLINPDTNVKRDQVDKWVEFDRSETIWNVYIDYPKLPA